MSSPSPEFTTDQQEVLQSVRASRVILPILIGVGVVAYLFWQQFDPQEWAAIDWNTATLFWVSVSLLLLVVRHLAYAMRLYILSEHDFSYKKCIKLVFIWEFSSAVSPTSIGGSAVALFVLAQEKLSAARTATLVLYTVVLDTAFFVFTLPLLYLIYGASMIRPGAESLANLGGWGVTFLFAYCAMAVYGLFLAWGLFISPRQIGRLLNWLASWRLLNRFEERFASLGNDMVAASQHMRNQPPPWHLGAFLSTAVAWSFRFLLLNCLFIAFVDLSTSMFTQFGLYARLEAMFVIIAFSPTPGGAGFVEVLFKNFLTDYVAGNATSSVLIATIWRLFTYYAYLLAGVIIIPDWIRGVIARRKARREQLIREEQAATDALPQNTGQLDSVSRQS